MCQEISPAPSGQAALRTPQPALHEGKPLLLPYILRGTTYGIPQKKAVPGI